MYPPCAYDAARLRFTTGEQQSGPNPRHASTTLAVPLAAPVFAIGLPARVS